MSQEKVADLLERAVKVILVVSLILIPLYFDKSLVGIYDISKATCLWISTLLIFGCGSALFLVKPVTPSKYSLTLPLIAWLSVNILSTAFSEAPIISLLGFYKRYDGLLTHIGYITLSFVAFYFCEREFLKKILKIIVFVGIISAIYAILQFYGTDIFFVEREERGRVISFMGNPIFACCYLIMTSFLALGLYFYHRGFWSWFFGTAFALIYLSSFYTKSRGGFLGFSLSFLLFSTIFFIFYKRLSAYRKKFLISLIIVILITIIPNISSKSLFRRFIIDFEINEKVEKIENNSLNIKAKGSVKVRLCIWKDIMKNVLRKPLFGTGPDTIAISYPKYRSLSTVRTVGAYATAESSHNEFLDVVATKGLLGLFSYLWILATFIHLAIKGLFREKEEGWLIAGISLSWLSYLLCNQTAFGVHPTASLFWMLTGAIGIFYKPKPVKRRERVRRLTKYQKFMLLGVTVFIFIFIFIIIRPYKADLLYRKAFDAKGEMELFDLIHLYEKILNMWPYDVQYLQELNSLYLAVSQQEKESKIWLRKARNVAERLLKVNPNSDVAYTVIATTYYLEDRANIDKVIEKFERAESLNPYSVDVHYNFGQMYQREGMFNEAISHFEKALASDPGSERVVRSLASLYLSFGRYDDAKRVLSEFLKTDPDNEYARSKLQSLEVQKF
jgi:tetratricopeptide (TPR) repeat protein